ncbi:MAG: sulfurtransferase TusA family protein [Vampirovibrio sp.]
MKPPLDLRQSKCPLNFVKAKLALEKIKVGESLDVWILPHVESALNLPESFRQAGHSVEIDAPESPEKQRLRITRCH